MNAKNTDFCIFEESPVDIPGIRTVNLSAFDGVGEANVVDRLRATSLVFISLVAKTENQVVGHILFTPVYIQQKYEKEIMGMGLAPLAVLPQFQGQGIGSALCTAGLARVESQGYPFVVVIGHPESYPRFGFEPARKHGIESTYKDVPDDVFMIRIFRPDALINVRGVAHYRPEFDEIT